MKQISLRLRVIDLFIFDNTDLKNLRSWMLFPSTKMRKHDNWFEELAKCSDIPSLRQAAERILIKNASATDTNPIEWDTDNALISKWIWPEHINEC